LKLLADIGVRGREISGRHEVDSTTQRIDHREKRLSSASLTDSNGEPRIPALLGNALGIIDFDCDRGSRPVAIGVSRSVDSLHSAPSHDEIHVSSVTCWGIGARVMRPNPKDRRRRVCAVTAEGCRSDRERDRDRSKYRAVNSQMRVATDQPEPSRRCARPENSRCAMLRAPDRSGDSRRHHRLLEERLDSEQRSNATQVSEIETMTGDLQDTDGIVPLALRYPVTERESRQFCATTSSGLVTTRLWLGSSPIW